MSQVGYSRIDEGGQPRWSVRILIGAVVGIFFLTMYPFRFASFTHPGHDHAYLLGGWGKAFGPFDAFLNVLLFVPFGFGLAEILRARGKSRLTRLSVALLAGALLSYTVEFLQFFIPFRDSGWEDVITNSTGSLAGFIFFELCGSPLVRVASMCERFLRHFLSLRRVVAILILYFGLWSAIAVPLQKKTRLSNWSENSMLVIGNGVSNQIASAWKGQIFQLEMWDHALPDRLAAALSSQTPAEAAADLPLAAWDFSSPPPFPDGRHFLPDLSWVPDTPVSGSIGSAVLDGSSRLQSASVVSAMVDRFQMTRQFSLRLLCKPFEVSGINSPIVSIAQPLGPMNLEVGQEESQLFVWLRTPLSAGRPALAWTTPGIFGANQPLGILLSYDGASLSLYVDGKKDPRTYQLGPATALARIVRRAKSVELDGYRYIFYALVFFPAGCIFGLAWHNLPARPLARSVLTTSIFLIPAVIFEMILIYISGRPLSPGNVALSVILAFGGSLWINADHAMASGLRSATGGG
jgi:VanZ family protein